MKVIIKSYKHKFIIIIIIIIIIVIILMTTMQQCNVTNLNADVFVVSYF